MSTRYFTNDNSNTLLKKFEGIAAFAPTTIGYPYHPIIAASGKPSEPRPIKVIKHLYDIGVLADIATNTGETIATYRKTHTEQIKFRETSHTLEDTLHDAQMTKARRRTTPKRRRIHEE